MTARELRAGTRLRPGPPCSLFLGLVFTFPCGLGRCRAWCASSTSSLHGGASCAWAARSRCRTSRSSALAGSWPREVPWWPAMPGLPPGLSSASRFTPAPHNKFDVGTWYRGSARAIRIQSPILFRSSFDLCRGSLFLRCWRMRRQPVHDPMPLAMLTFSIIFLLTLIAAVDLYVFTRSSQGSEVHAAGARVSHKPPPHAARCAPSLCRHRSGYLDPDRDDCLAHQRLKTPLCHMNKQWWARSWWARSCGVH